MFTDEVLDPVGPGSLWRAARQAARESRGCQTRAVHRAEAEIQTLSATIGWTQTEPEPQEQLLQQSHEEPDPPGLKDFLQRVEGAVIRELVSNARSHAFDGFQVDWEDQSQPVSCLHRLQHPSAQESGLHVTSLSWTCTGSVVACAYGRTDGGDWTTQSSWVCLWNLDRRSLNPQQADRVLEVPTAVTALCCHPKPDPLDLVAWVQQQGALRVLSACSGGRVLLWTLDSERLVLQAALALVLQQLPHSSSFTARGSGSVGLSSLALSPWDPDTFLVGSEGGLLLRCSFSSQTPSEDHVALRAPVVFLFRPRSGPVHSIHCSPFHRNLFVSTGADGLLHLHSLLQAEPLTSIRLSDRYGFQVQWSPSRPLVLAAATGQGEVQVFDLGRGSQRPVATLEMGGANMEMGGANQAATCLAFNPQNHRLLAAGRTDGTVCVWQLSHELTEQNPRESGRLEQIANQASE
ncbi:WD repeat-containing protein 34 [Pseudoliparis swirei]|uniref:WD repeat-containing protein 34 n=1 Tax=Pseudoliparis swirei TaxID=2059687 RepID=UPI0024BE7506|nr:WD repeat-containing protein 34 [Pseudoliparis swirei]